MRYNAGNGGVQLSVNLISRLEEERPTRLYACREWIRTPDQALGNSRFSRLGHPGGLCIKFYQKEFQFMVFNDLYGVYLVSSKQG